MHKDRLRASRGGGKSMRGAHTHHFIGAGDDLRYRLAGRARDCNSFHYGRVIAAEIGEYKFDAEILQDFEQSRTGCVGRPRRSGIGRARQIIILSDHLGIV
jgi:hypothetical protein